MNGGLSFESFGHTHRESRLDDEDTDFCLYVLAWADSVSNIGDRQIYSIMQTDDFARSAKTAKCLQITAGGKQPESQKIFQHGLGAGPHVKFFVDMLEMRADGVDADGCAIRNL